MNSNSVIIEQTIISKTKIFNIQEYIIVKFQSQKTKVFLSYLYLSFSCEFTCTKYGKKKNVSKNESIYLLHYIFLLDVSLIIQLRQR